MPPSEVMNRFTEEEMVNLIAYENMFGPVGPKRFDYLFARLGMDVVAPHLKRGTKANIEDHMIKWGPKQPMTPDQMLKVAKGIQSAYDRDEVTKRKKASARRTRKEGQHGDSGRSNGSARARRGRPGQKRQARSR